MYGVALGLAGSEPKNVYERVAVGLLRKLSSSPAGIFVPGSGYLQALDNKLTYSNDLSNAAWVTEFTASKSGSNILTPAVGDNVYHGTTVAAGSYTLAAQLSGSGTCTLFAYNATDHIHGETQVTLTSTPTIFAANITSTDASTFYYIGRRTGDTATSITFGGAGLFAGTYTAQQVAALGIPLTTSSAVSAVYTDAHVYLPGANGVAVSGLPTNNYTLSNGSTGYSAVDGTAGLVLDAAGSVGTELVDSPVNGTASGSWVVNTSGVTRNGSLTGQAAVNVSSAATLPVTKTYKVTFTTSGMSGDSIGFRIGGGTAYGPIASDGTYTYIVQGGGSTNLVFIPWSGTLGQATITGMSVKEVTGIHATQSTTANKPAVRRGLYNLLTYSNDLSNAAWIKNGVGGSAQLLTPSASSGQHFVNVSIAQTGTPANTFAVIAKASGYNWLGLCVSGSGITMFDLESGSVGTTTTGGTPSILPLGDGYYLCAVTRTYAGAVSYTFVEPSDGQSTWTPDGVSGIEILGSGLFAGTLTASQILSEGGIPLTTSAAASNSGAGRYSLQFDGTNDSLSLGSVPFQLNDDFLVVVGVCYTAPTSWSTVVSLSGATTTPRIQLYLDNTTGFVGAYFRDDASVNAQMNGVASIIGTSCVVTLLKVGTNCYLRVNGVQVATTSVAALGAMTLTGASIGRLFNGTDYMAGFVGEVILVKGTVSTSDALTLERQVASTFPAAPSF